MGGFPPLHQGFWKLLTYVIDIAVDSISTAIFFVSICATDTLREQQSADYKCKNLLPRCANARQLLPLAVCLLPCA